LFANATIFQTIILPQFKNSDFLPIDCFAALAMTLFNSILASTKQQKSVIARRNNEAISLNTFNLKKLLRYAKKYKVRILKTQLIA